MAQGRGANVSLAQLKRELDSLSHDLLNIDLQIQQVKQCQANPHSLETLEKARSQIKQEVICKQIQFEQKKAQNKQCWVGIMGGPRTEPSWGYVLGKAIQ